MCFSGFYWLDGKSDKTPGHSNVAYLGSIDVVLWQRLPETDWGETHLGVAFRN